MRAAKSHLVGLRKRPHPRSPTHAYHESIPTPEGKVQAPSLPSRFARTLELLLRHAQNKAIKRIGHLDLAAQAAGGAHVEGEVQHVLLHLGGATSPVKPRFIHKDMTGGTRARPATLRLDTLHQVLLGLLHDRHAVLGINHLLGAIRLDERDFGHEGRLSRAKTAPWRGPGWEPGWDLIGT